MKHIIFISLILFAAPLFADDAWNVIKTYNYGDDFKPLLAVETEVQRSLASPEAKAKTAARLAALLEESTSYPGRQFVCMQLRLVGGAAEVPKLAEYLNKPDDSENARLALTDILCGESLLPLRKALGTFKGRALVGVIGSLAARNDRASIPAFAKLIGDPDKEVAQAAISALGLFGADGLDVLTQAKVLPAAGHSLIRIASDLTEQGKTEDARIIYDKLSAADMPKGIRRAALEGVLRLYSIEQRKKTITDWLFDEDSEKVIIAVSHLTELPGEQFDELFKKTETMNAAGRLAFLELASERDEAATLEELLNNLESSDTRERLAALRAISKRGDAAVIPVLIAALEQDDLSKNIAKEALIRFPANNIGPKLVEAIQLPASRTAAIDVIVALKYYDAIAHMIILAKSEDDTLHTPVIDGLGRLCDPDEYDLPRLLTLYLSSRPGAHREKVERALVVVCEKHPQTAERADKLFALLEKREGGLSEQLLIEVLPLLGKVGNQRVAKLIRPLLTDDTNPALQQAAMRALCNWHNADYLDDLWKIAAENPVEQYRQWALRAYIRVGTLKSDRPESETLSMLKKAMSIAKNDADREWCLSRAATVRTMETVHWAASFLDDSVLSQTACRVIVELAHHRFLREPNKSHFEPILLKVEQTAVDKAIAERAKKSRLGM